MASFSAPGQSGAGRLTRSCGGAATTADRRYLRRFPRSPRLRPGDFRGLAMSAGPAMSARGEACRRNGTGAVPFQERRRSGFGLTRV